MDSFADKITDDSQETAMRLLKGEFWKITFSGYPDQFHAFAAKVIQHIIIHGYNA